MAFEDDFARHVDQVKQRLPHVRGEESTKHSLVVPLLALLGYDVWDPREVLPEYGADFTKQKRAGQVEKVDYAIQINGAPVIFVECKAVGGELDNHDGQLSRYYNTTPSVRVGIITNGVRIKVFTDLKSPNIMDDKPWMDFDLRTAKTAEIDALKRFRKADFAPDQIVSLAEEMLYYSVLLGWVSSQIREPSEPLVRLVAESIPSITRIDKKVVDRLTPILRKAIQAAILDNVARSLSAPAPAVEEPAAPQLTAAAGGARAPSPAAAAGVAAAGAPAPSSTATPAPAATNDGARDGIVTTPEELESHAIIARLVWEKYPEAAVTYRDAKSYFTVTQRDNWRKWFIRVGIERAPFWIAFRHVKVEAARALLPGVDIIDGGGHGESKVMIRAVGDISRLGPLILAAYEAEAARVIESVDSAPVDGDSSAS